MMENRRLYEMQIIIERINLNSKYIKSQSSDYLEGLPWDRDIYVEQ